MSENPYQRWRDIMKCYPLEEKRLLRYPKPWLVQPKYNGIRCRAKYHTQLEQWILYSSEANIIVSVPHILSAFEEQIPPNHELDGELYVHNMPLSEILSITSRSTNNLHLDRHLIQYHLFDIVDEHLRQDERLKILKNFQPLKAPLQAVPTWECYSIDQVYDVFQTLIEKNYEGIIVRSPHNFYKRKRSTEVMKFKPKKRDSYKIVGFKMEYDIYGVPKNSLGALICDSGDGKTTFDVGTGFTDLERKTLWENREALIGQYAHISYQQLTARNKVPCFVSSVEIKNEC